MRISVVIPTYNSEKTIEECLLSLHEQTSEPYEIIVVDGKSRDSTFKIVKKFESVKLLVINEHIPVGKARNIGGESAGGDILLFCDSDCVADGRALEHHAKAYERKADIVGVMGSIGRAGVMNEVSVFVQRQIMASEWLQNLNSDGTIRSYLNSANLSMDKKSFLQMRFREDLTSCEDTELLIRLKKMGLEILYEPRALMRHHHPTTIEELFRQRKWFGEGIFQLEKMHGRDFTDLYPFFSPVRYVHFQEQHLYKAVFSDNRLLCDGCRLDTVQGCRISKPQLTKERLSSDENIHRITCLAVAAGILKQRTEIDYHWQVSKN